MSSPLNARFEPSWRSLQVTFLRPAPTSEAAALSVSGAYLGCMYARGKPHHHRVLTPDGVTHIVPPNWLTDMSRLDIKRLEMEAPNGNLRLVVDLADTIDSLRLKAAPQG